MVLIHVAYDVERAAQRIEAASMPDEFEETLRTGASWIRPIFLM